ncbi:uncharacterized protein LOC142664355 [Rhinoderma darwinii]|uniref:uncharacterized protein LOC142664355 n=1 Tax=Rhinoderma darwinii TaxID=43563 RepID=UPI003F669D3C
MWISLFFLCMFVKGVSFTDNCNKTRNVSYSSGESFTLDIDQHEVKDNTLINGSGNVIAKIENGTLHILDERYKHRILSNGVDFQIKSATPEDQGNYTASVLYINDAHCTQHYVVTLRDNQICGEIKAIRVTAPENDFRLEFDTDGVEKIDWNKSSIGTIAVTEDKAKLQILDSDYKGNLSVIGVSLCKHNANIKDHGNYTATVSFHNGTRCLQHYIVNFQSYHWLNFFVPNLNSLLSLLLVVIIGRLLWICLRTKKCLKKKVKTINKESISESDDGTCQISVPIPHRGHRGTTNRDVLIHLWTQCKQFMGAPSSPSEHLMGAPSSPSEHLMGASSSPSEHFMGASSSPSEHLMGAPSSPSERLMGAPSSPSERFQMPPDYHPQMPPDYHPQMPPDYHPQMPPDYQPPTLCYPHG